MTRVKSEAWAGQSLRGGDYAGNWEKYCFLKPIWWMWEGASLMLSNIWYQMLEVAEWNAQLPSQARQSCLVN